MRRLGLWARRNPVKVLLGFLVLTFLGFTVEQQIGGTVGFVAYFILMFSAIVLVAAFVRGGKRR